MALASKRGRFCFFDRQLLYAFPPKTRCQRAGMIGTSGRDRLSCTRVDRWGSTYHSAFVIVCTTYFASPPTTASGEKPNSLFCKAQSDGSQLNMFCATRLSTWTSYLQMINHVVEQIVLGIFGGAVIGEAVLPRSRSEQNVERRSLVARLLRWRF